MTWVILTGRQSDLDQVATPHKIITNRDYLAHPALFRGQRPKVINLSNSYAYQSRGYYASLLAGSRGHKVIPSVETMIDLSERKLYEHALPELEQAPNQCPTPLRAPIPATRPPSRALQTAIPGPVSPARSSANTLPGGELACIPSRCRRSSARVASPVRSSSRISSSPSRFIARYAPFASRTG